MDTIAACLDRMRGLLILTIRPAKAAAISALRDTKSLSNVKSAFAMIMKDLAEEFDKYWQKEVQEGDARRPSPDP